MRDCAMTSHGLIIVVTDGPIARVTINRPDKLNALDAAVIADLTAAFLALENDPSIRVAILSGAGDRAFAAGADIAAMAAMTSEQARAFAAAGHALGERIESARFPVLAQVQGFALGGGCELAMACDLIYAGEKAKFGQPEVGLGVIPGFGGTQRLKRRVGAGKCRELIFRGHVIDAKQALQIGLVDDVFPQDALADEVTKIARGIAAQAPLAIAQAKRVMRAGHDVPLAVANELEIQAFGVCFGTEDQKTGMRAFIENPKAPRTFHGR
jgi:enoyl-CoA hydratase